MSTPLYPDVYVPLVGEDGNAYAIIGRVSKALRRAGHTQAVEEFTTAATSGDYDHLLRTCMEYVNTWREAEDEDADSDE